MSKYPAPESVPWRVVRYAAIGFFVLYVFIKTITYFLGGG